MITIIYLVDEYGITFNNKKDAAAFLREKQYSEGRLAYYKRAFGATYSEESIVYLINNKIREVELR